MKARSTIGSASDSKSGGWGFDSLRACQHQENNEAKFSNYAEQSCRECDWEPGD